MSTALKRKFLAIGAREEGSMSPSSSRSSRRSDTEASPPSKASRANSSRVNVRFGGRKALSPSSFAPPHADIVLTCGDEMNGVLGQGYLDEDKEEPRGSKKPRRIDDVLEGEVLAGVAATGMHTAVLTNQGKVYTAGCNDDGALGFPVKPSGDGPSADTSATSSEGMSVDSTQSSSVPKEEDEPTDQHAQFKAVPLPQTCLEYGKVIQVAGGDSHMAVLTEGGAVLAWGTYRGDSGRIGIRDWDSKSFTINQLNHIPKLALHPKYKCVKVTSGNDHTLALTQSGEVLSWGFGKCGQLGRVNPVNMNAEVGDRQLFNWLRPALVKWPSIGKCRSMRAVNIWACGYSSFALITNSKGEERTVVAWGLNAYHQLGICSESEKHNPGEHVWRPTPADAFNAMEGVEWTHFAGEQQVIACSRDGRVYGLGLNSDSHLGLGDEEAGTVIDEGDDNYIINHTQGLDGNPLQTKTRARRALARIHLPDDAKAVGVAAGPKNSYAWSEDGSLYSWGFSPDGALGLGADDEPVTRPTKVKSKHLEGYKVVHAAAGAQHLVIMAAKVSSSPPPNNGGKLDEQSTHTSNGHGDAH